MRHPAPGLNLRSVDDPWNMFLIPLYVAVVSMSVLLTAMLAAWLGPSVGAGNFCCEAARNGLIKQPANTWSNIGFIAVGLTCAWFLMRGTFHQNSNILTRSKPTGILFCLLPIVLGVGSIAMHATETNIGGELDMFGMYMVSSFLVAYATRRFFGGNWFGFLLVLFVSLLLCELTEIYDQHIPVIEYAGNIAFAVLIVIAGIFEMLIGSFRKIRRENKWGIYALTSCIAAFAVWNIGKNGNPLCDPNSLIQGHAAWHLFLAFAMFFLFRFYVSENAAAARRSQL